jgi:hypothetical protein
MGEGTGYNGPTQTTIFSEYSAKVILVMEEWNGWKAFGKRD